MNKGFIYIPEKCQISNIVKLELKKQNKEDIVNPYYIRCNNNKCRKKKNLRTYSFMNKIKNIPASVCFMILKNIFLL